MAAQIKVYSKLGCKWDQLWRMVKEHSNNIGWYLGGNRRQPFSIALRVVTTIQTDQRQLPTPHASSLLCVARHGLVD